MCQYVMTWEREQIGFAMYTVASLRPVMCAGLPNCSDRVAIGVVIQLDAM